MSIGEERQVGQADLRQELIQRPHGRVEDHARHQRDRHRRQQHRQQQGDAKQPLAGHARIQRQRDAEADRVLQPDCDEGDQRRREDRVPEPRLLQQRGIIAEPDHARRDRRDQPIAEEARGQRIDQRKDRDRQHDKHCRPDEDMLDRIIPHHRVIIPSAARRSQHAAALLALSPDA